MRQPWRIFNLAAALSDWNWWFAPNRAAVPADLLEDLTFEEGQIDTVHGVVGVAIPQAGHNLPTAAFAVPDNQPSYIPRPSVGILSPDHVAVFNLTASQPASATLREWPLQRVLGA